MCSHYQAAKKLARLRRQFPKLDVPDEPWKWDVWPKYDGLFLRRPPERDSGDEAVPEVEAVVGRWGLVSGMTKPGGLPRALKLSTFNARSESAAKSFTFGHAWRKRQRCIIPAEAFFEPDWRSGKAIATRFTAADGEELGIAGLWDQWRDEAGQVRESYTMLTVNADDHPLLRDYHRPNDEKRMIVILPAGSYRDWFDAPVEATMEFMRPYPADQLVASPVQKAP